ncbi:MAG: hypothetical protein KDA96_07265 [Planctomycetaceae bacterium]|nr:hypothetical protein [Planctomycetaceae bacterium]
MTDGIPEQTRRRIVGLLAIAAVVAGTMGIWFKGLESAWAASCLRVGILLGALWLALPGRRRQAAWAFLTWWKLLGIVVATLLISRLKYLLPVLIAGFAIGWFLRPRRKTRS